MAFSLLYLNSKGSVSDAPKRIVYHLSLDRSFSYICADVKKRERFLSIISELTDDKDEISYRQEIIKDLEGHPDLLEELTSMSERFDELQRSQKTVGRLGNKVSLTGATSSASAKNLLQTQALCLKRALLFVKAYRELLESYGLKSRGLCDFYSYCKEFCESPDYSRLLTFCSKYESFGEASAWDFKLRLNREGRIEEYALIDHRYIRVTDPELKRKGFSIFKKAEETVYPCERLRPLSDELYERLSTSAISELSGLFANLAEQVIEKFALLSSELVFYDVALKYLKALSLKQAPICYPTFSEDNGIRVKGLYDLYLLTSMPNTADVIPNDLMFDSGTGGLIVLGNNGSGKTVYLRSIGTMQLLAQAGLPIPCESAEITVFSQLATQFSEAEKEFCLGNDAGRFEQEVRELAEMVDTLREGSAVFLNETFQSTSYPEGAEGLYHILKHFSLLNIRWLLVSHLKQLEEMLGLGEALVLHTGTGFKIG